MARRNFKIAFLLSGLVLSGCGLIKKQQPSDEDLNAAVVRASKTPMPPEKTKELLNEVGSNWLFGQGVGETAVNIGTAVIFPPYLIYLLGNAALSISGYEPITVSKMLPDEAGKNWSATYDTVTSGPGKVAAAIAGEEFRTDELAKGRIKKVLDSVSRDTGSEK